MKRKWNVKRSQWLGVLVLIIIIAAVEAVIYFAPKPIPDTPTTEEVDSLKQSIKMTHKYTRKTPIYNPHPFDPNTADSIVLTEVGFRGWQARNILKYRAAGGKFKTKESLKRIYGMTDSLYMLIEPWVEIDSALWITPLDTITADTTKHYSIKKDTIIELNTADTTTLKYIHHVGSYRAKKIIAYREELGGYLSPEQVREIRFNIPEDQLDSIIVHLTACPDSIRQIDVNHASVRRLTNHPYISFKQACDIYDLRRSRIRLRDIETLRKLESISDTDIVRLKPYLSFK